MVHVLYIYSNATFYYTSTIFNTKSVTNTLSIIIVHNHGDMMFGSNLLIGVITVIILLILSIFVITIFRGKQCIFKRKNKNNSNDLSKDDSSADVDIEYNHVSQPTTISQNIGGYNYINRYSISRHICDDDINGIRDTTPIVTPTPTITPTHKGTIILDDTITDIIPNILSINNINKQEYSIIKHIKFNKDNSINSVLV